MYTWVLPGQRLQKVIQFCPNKLIAPPNDLVSFVTRMYKRHYNNNNNGNKINQ